MLKVSETSLEINGRFFLAIETLRRQRKLRGLESFSKKYGFVRGNLHTIKTQNKGCVKAEYLHYLAKDFGVSPEWLLLGTGEMFTQTTSKTL